MSEKDEERFVQFQLTEDQVNLQNKAVDLIFDLMTAAMTEMQDAGADANTAASTAINAGSRGLLFFASCVYGSMHGLEDHEKMSEARLAAYEFIQKTLEHAHSKAAEYHRGNLN